MAKSKKKKEIKVGIIGAGGIAQGAHIPGYQSVEGVKIIAVCDIDKARAKQVAEKVDAPYVFEKYQDLVAMDELDAISVCTPNNFHRDPTVAALKAGKHVLCEKPIAGNAKDGQVMVDAAKKAKKILQIGLHQRFQKSSQILKDFIEAGELGEPYYARAIALRRRGIPSWGVFIEKDKSGGGPLVDIGVHILDLIIWLMGNPKPISASGATYTKFGNRRDVVSPTWGTWNVEKFDVEDFAVGLIRFENGITVTLETSWAANIDGAGSSFILGDKGGAQLSPLRLYQQQHNALVDVTPVVPQQRENPHTTEVRAFIDAIREGKPSPVPGEQALEITKIFDAIYKSSKTGRQILIKS